MTSTQSPGQILKTDSLERLRTPPPRKEQLLDEFERSGLSGPKFSQLAGVKYPTFAAWVAKRKRVRSSATPAPATKPLVEPARVQWLEAVVNQANETTASKPSMLTIYFGQEARAEIADARQAELAAALLLALNKPSPC